MILNGSYTYFIKSVAYLNLTNFLILNLLLKRNVYTQDIKKKIYDINGIKPFLNMNKKEYRAFL